MFPPPLPQGSQSWQELGVSRRVNSPWELNSGDLGAGRADSQTGLAVPHPGEAGPAGQATQAQEEKSIRLSLSVGFRKIPAWKISCPPHTTI